MQRTVNATRRTARKTRLVPPGLAAAAVGLDGLARSPGVGQEGHEVLHGSALFVVSLDPREQPATQAMGTAKARPDAGRALMLERWSAGTAADGSVGCQPRVGRQR